MQVFDLFQFSNRYVAGPNLAHSKQSEVAFWYEVAQSDCVKNVILSTVEGQKMKFDECRDKIFKGISLGMLKRLHKHVIVKQQQPKSYFLSKIMKSGITKCDELCLLTQMSEISLLETLSLEAPDSFYMFYF